VAVVATALGGTGRYIREGYADVTLAIRAASVTVLGAVIGARVGVLIPAHVLELGFAALIFAVSFHMMRRGADGEVEGPPRVAQRRGIVPGGGPAGRHAGRRVGHPQRAAIRLSLKRSITTAVATSSMIVAFTGAAGASVYARAGHMDWPLAVACTTGAFAGATWARGWDRGRSAPRCN